jgi:hypothetical protein
MRKAHVGALLLSLVAAFACERAEPERGRSSPASTEAAAAGPASSAELPLPPEGRVEVSIGADGVLALANRAPRRRVLEALAHETGLLVVAFAPGGDPEGLVTLRSRGEPIEVVLARALVGVPFSVGSIERGESDRLAVVVGWREEAGRAPPAPPVARREVERGELAERAERVRESEAPDLAQLKSDDASERAEAIEGADVDTVAGFEAVVERLSNDPDASVRAAAAETLGEGDVGSVGPLLDALADPDPRVVLAALESLELLGDASILPALAPVLEHPDAGVRERAAELGEFLE